MARGGSSQASTRGAATRGRQKPTFVDLFAGCGGLSVGLMQAGWRGLFGIECQSDAYATLAANLLDGNRHSYRNRPPAGRVVTSVQQATSGLF